MNSNANYLLSPNKLSTKVAYAPGGHSSLSLAWDTPNPVVNKPKSKSSQPTNAYQITQNMQPHRQLQILNHYQREPRQYSQEYYQPPKQNVQSMVQSNRLLEEQLRYYQQKNRMLRQNIFGGYQNLQKINKFSSSNPHYEQNYYQYSSNDPSNSPKPYYQRGSEQLDLAVYQQDKRRQRERISSQSSFMRNNSSMPSNDHYQQKTSVKVNNPPGGRSSIVFG